MELWNSHLDTVVSIEAIFCEPGEFQLLSHSSVDGIQSIPIEFRLCLQLMNAKTIEMDIELGEMVTITIKRNHWLSRDRLEAIQNHIATFEILDAVEYVKEQCQEYLLSQQEKQEIIPFQTVALKRVWFYLVSLSTKSKRDDLVDWAPDYNLTGFVMAGKPGILCLEGPVTNIDSFISAIKSRSWADIPSNQKKISVVLEESITNRNFRDMKEITHEFEMGGFLNNRPNMSQVKEWFENHGVGYAFTTVVQLN
jgi:hypothetical protein